MKLNIKLIICVCSVIGALSIFLPWYEGFGHSVSGINSRIREDGIIMAGTYIAIILNYLAKDIFIKKKDIITLVIGILTLMMSIGSIIANNKVRSLGVNIGLGLYIAILTSVIIIVLAFIIIKEQYNLERLERFEIVKQFKNIIIKSEKFIKNKKEEIMLNSSSKDMSDTKDEEQEKK